MSDNKNASTKRSDTYVPKSDSHYYKSFGGFNNFMRSYGLKPWDYDDVQEGKAIIEGFRKRDRQDWEEEQKNKS